MKAERKMRLTRELISRVPPPPPNHPASAPTSSSSDGLREASAAAILSRVHEGGELWVFAYGSLMWKPSAEFVPEPVAGIIRGWHRAFCLGWDRGYRGNEINPGLMLSLDRGGQCRGLTFRVRNENLAENLMSVLRREPPIRPRWVKVVTAGGVLEAIAFTNDRKHNLYVGGLSQSQIADALAKASGRYGSMADYLFNTINHLRALGIHDRYLWGMQEMVAERLEAEAPLSLVDNAAQMAET